MIDYKAIIDELQEDKVKELMEQLGAEVIDKNGYLMIQTLCHNADCTHASHKLYYYKNTHLFYCYTECGTAMSIFTLLKKYYEVRNIDYDWYNDIYKVVLNCSLTKLTRAPSYKSIRSNYEDRKNRRELETYDEKVLNIFSHQYHQSWIDEGITIPAMEKYNILFSQSQNKIIIPHYNINGGLVGRRGRALNAWEIDNLGKYMPVQIEKQWYSHPLSLNLYGLNVSKDAIAREGVCYVVEGEKSCLKVEGFDMPNCSVAACGSNFNKYQLDILIRTVKPREIILCFDKEDNTNDKYFNKLYELCSKYKNYCNMSFIIDKQNLLQLKDSPVDCGESTFKKLLQQRVKI